MINPSFALSTSRFPLPTERNSELEQRNRELEQRLRELELQFAYERRIRECETKLDKLSADIDAGHARTAAPLTPLKGGRDAA